MEVKLLKIKGTWRDIADSARTTVGMKAGETQEVASNWKHRILLAEHSPIRKLLIDWKWYELPSWVSVHFVRHKYGIEHWVRSQRTDRTGEDRGSQNALIEHECEANAQAIINISRKRLCYNASKETREAWIALLFKLIAEEPELVKVCVPDCIYRGHCYEYESCGFYKTEKYQTWLSSYRYGINE